MALEAGSVYAILGGRFNPAGFAQFDGAMKRSVGKTKAAEGAMASSFARTGTAAQAMSASVASAAAKMQAAQLAQQKAALRVEGAMVASAAATKKHGAESLVARQRALQLAQAQQQLTQANNSLASATAAHAAAQQQLTTKQSAGSKAAQALGLTSRNVATAGIAAIGFAIYGSLKASARFQTQMAELGAVTGASGADLKKMGDAAMQVGAKTGTGATKAAQAMTELAKGGLDANTATKALTGTVAMAQAGSLDLATAGETVANALNLFAMDGNQATQVADAFANAANSTTADIGFFSQGMAQGGAAAKAAGLNFQEATVFLEAMAANGFKSGSDAGTSMKTALIQLANPSKRAAEEINKLGISFFKTNGDMKSLPTISKQLGDAWDGLSKKEKLASAARLAGTDGMRALFALVDQGPKKLRDFADANQQSGTAAEVARKKMESLSGQSQRLGAELEAVGIKLGNNLEPYLADAAGALADFFAQMRSGEGFGGTVANIAQSFLRLSQTVQAVLTGFSGKDPWLRLSEIWGQGFTQASLRVLGAIRAIAAAIQAAASIGGKFNPFRGLGQKAGEAVKNIDGITSSLRALDRKQTRVKLIADNKEALAGIRQVNSSKINKLVAKILADDQPFSVKYKQLRALKIPDKIAKILARSESAAAAIDRIKNKLASLQDRTINVRTVYSETGRLPKSGIKVGASGFSAGNKGTALIGEGGGPEYVVDTATGTGRKVTGPEIVALKDSEYVIPTESKYRGRALGLMAQMAQDMGIAGYKKGKKGKSAPSRPAPSRPAPSRGGGNSRGGGGSRGDNGAAAAAERRRQEERAAAAKRKRQEGRRKILGSQVKAFSVHSLDWYDQEIAKEERYKDNKGKNKKLTERAKKARERLKKLRAEKKKAQQYKAKIDRATSEADIALDDMRTADTQDNQGAFNEAWNKRKRFLADAIALLSPAIAQSDKASTWNRELRAQLAKLRGDQADLGANPPPVTDDAAEEATFNAAEQQRLAQLEAGIATAQLTTTVEDDRAALQAKIDFLTPILGAATSNAGAGRGGYKAITEIANDLRSTRDQLQSLTDPNAGPSPDPGGGGGGGDTGPTPDQQALIDQAKAQGLAAGQTAFIDRLTQATMANAKPTLVFQSYVPPSPSEAKRLADYTVGGINYQGQSPSSTERVGV